MKNKVDLSIKGLIVLVIITFFSSCATRQLVTIKFDPIEDEIVAREKLNASLKTDKAPSIVLRVPNVTKESTQSEGINNIYNLIEKELIKNGFIGKRAVSPVLLMPDRRYTFDGASILSI